MHSDRADLDLSWLPSPGTILADRYRLVSLLGTGGMAAVLMAEHIQLHERVAIKFLHPKIAANAESHERFRRESRISSLIKCEHVVRTLDVGSTPEGLSYLVMEYLEGEDLSARLHRDGPYPLELAVDCVLQAAEALALAHAAGVVHRDIKPSNLWLSRRHDGSPLLKVLDFGISKLFSGAHADPSLTETSSVFGSPTYMSPEQIRSAKRVDARADIWALGIVLYELLTARLPFEGDNVGGILASITADEPIAPTVFREDLPAVVQDVVLACLEKNPTRRITLAEMCTELRPFATPSGALSAERVARAGAPSPDSAVASSWRERQLRTPPPAVGASTLSAATIRMEQPKARSRWLVLGGAGAVAAIGIGTWIARTPTDRPEPTSGAASTDVAGPLAASLPPTTTLTQASASPGPSAAPVPSAVASAARTVASGKPMPTNGGTKPGARPSAVPPLDPPPPLVHPTPAPAPSFAPVANERR